MMPSQMRELRRGDKVIFDRLPEIDPVLTLTVYDTDYDTNTVICTDSTPNTLYRVNPLHIELKEGDT